MTNPGSRVSALILAFGLVAAALVFTGGFVQSRAAGRYVTVKGIAERDVQAGLALWPLRFVATDDRLDIAQAAIARGHDAVMAFLERHGIDRTKVEVQGLEVTDVLANVPRRSRRQSLLLLTCVTKSRSMRWLLSSGDRFGQLPEMVQNLFFQMRVKLLAEKAGLSSISWESGQLVLRYPVAGEDKAGERLADLGPGIRGGKSAYWCSFGERWQPRLLDTLALIQSR